MRSISFLSLIFLWFCISCSRDNKTEEDSNYPQDRPNIIFLLTDDLRWDALGFMGNNHIITPHLDNLADVSVSFINAYHVAPICMPSRSSIMTGKYLGTHGSSFDRPTNYVITEKEFSVSYPVLLRKAGYYTGFIGKFGFAVSEDSTKIVNKNLWTKEEYMPEESFDEWYGYPGQGQYRLLKDSTFNGYDNKWQATHLNEFMGYQADEFLENANAQNKPFCLSLSFKAPHAPFDPEEHVRRLYDNREIPRMVNDDPNYFEKLPEVVKKKSRNAQWYFGIIGRSSWNIEKDTTYQEFIKNYYALITGVDIVVGQIRHKLNKLGIANNTVIIFTSDNGFFCGSRQLMGKALLYDESAKAPMIVYDPRYMKEGRKEQGLISHVDIAPTILDLAGVEKPGNMPGKSFNDAVYGENNFDNFEPVISEVDNPENYQSIRSKFVRTKNFKFIRYHECHPVVEELFRIDKDTLEHENLIDKEEYRDIVRKMRNMLDSFEEKFVHYGKGNYKISLRRFPRESGLGFNDEFPAKEDKIETQNEMPASNNVGFKEAYLYVADFEKSAEIKNNDEEINFTMNQPKGKFDLEARLFDKKGRAYPVYYLYIEKL